MPEEMGEGMKKGRGMPQMDKRKIFVINLQGTIQRISYSMDGILNVSVMLHLSLSHQKKPPTLQR